MIKIKTSHEDYRYVNRHHIIEVRADYGCGDDCGSIVITTGGGWITSAMSVDEVVELIRLKGEK